MLNIIWSFDALEDVLDTIDYLEKRWTKKEVEMFSEKINAILDQLSRGNLTFKPSAYKNTFEVPIVKQITLYYQIQNDDILLVRFWNNYRNPNSLVIK
jgi:plasmid stabilization system protein ParE